MKKGRFTEEQIIGVLKQHESGRKVPELARGDGVSGATIHTWKPRYGYRRLHAVLSRRGSPVSPQRVYRVYKAEGLMVRRLRRKRLSRVAVASHLVRSNQEWALDFVSDALATGRGIRVLTVVDA